MDLNFEGNFIWSGNIPWRYTYTHKQYTYRNIDNIYVYVYIIIFQIFDFSLVLGSNWPSHDPTMNVNNGESYKTIFQS